MAECANPSGPPGQDLTTKEGAAVIFSPPTVFYNPVQEFNRDLTIAVVTQFAKDRVAERRGVPAPGADLSESEEPAAKRSRNGNSLGMAAVGSDTVSAATSAEDVQVEPMDASFPELEAGKVYEDGLRILEGLAATGLRSVRFALEVPGIKKIVANDYSEIAVSYIKRNIAHNQVEHLVEPSFADASMLMYQNRKYHDRFDVVDVDPYGSPSAFLDPAVQAVADGGLLCVTCTDLATLCGNFPETCHSKYGAVAVRGKFCHEMALRIMLQSIEASANRYSRYVVPLLSVSADFYIRMFMRVYTGQAKVKESITKLSMIYVCSGCGAYHLQPMGVQHRARGDDSNFKYTAAVGPPVTELCEHCGFKHHLAGPIWSSRIHDVGFVQRVVAGVSQPRAVKLGTMQRIRGMLMVVSEELQDVPLYYVTDELCKMMHCVSPTQLQIRSALMNACYPVSLSHAAKNSIKTTAPMAVIWDIVRCWVQKSQSAGNPGRIKEGSVAFALRAKQPSITADFTVRADANPGSKKSKLKRFQVNPEPNWGPKAKAGPGADVSLEERREKGMVKKKKRKPRDNSFLKRFPCKRLKQGKCTLGDECRYSHSIRAGGDAATAAASAGADSSDTSTNLDSSLEPTNRTLPMENTPDEAMHVAENSEQLQDNQNLYTSF